LPKSAPPPPRSALPNDKFSLHESTAYRYADLSY
jgi:hypothetical protein